jgi:hypothetical protein
MPLDILIAEVHKPQQQQNITGYVKGWGYSLISGMDPNRALEMEGSNEDISTLFVFSTCVTEEGDICFTPNRFEYFGAGVPESMYHKDTITNITFSTTNNNTDFKVSGPTFQATFEVPRKAIINATGELNFNISDGRLILVTDKNLDGIIGGASRILAEGPFDQKILRGFIKVESI